MRNTRAAFFTIVLVALILPGAPDAAEEPQALAGPPVRIGLTPALLHYQHSLNAKWKTYLEERLRRPVVFVQRDSYRETMDLLAQQRIDFAWVCSYPFVTLKDEVKLLVVPLYQGRTVYRSYLIVRQSDTTTSTIADLKGRVFAYADPLSNSGYVAPRFALKKLGADPNTFFKRTFFTWSHRMVIQAVADGLSDGGAVDSYVWDSLALLDPSLVRRTRIVSQSQEFGFPPIVAHRSVSHEDFTRLQDVFLEMNANPAGREILGRLNLDGFTRGNRAMYNSVAEMARTFGEL
jgi:phosphonate transport system substrate-binding protein